MKTHGPNSPQTIRGLLNRRTQRALLDTRRMAEADLRTAEYVGPFGKEFHTVKNAGGDETYIVADQTGGRTFSPGAAVVLGSETGLPGEAIFGGAPAGKKGGVSRTRSRRSRGTPSLTSNQYAFGEDGATIYASLYDDATFVSARGTTTFGGETFTGCVLSDSSTLIGDGSLLMKEADTLSVWDVEGSATYTYTVPAGWTNPSALRYSGGFLYWVEIEDIPDAAIGSGEATFDYRLRKAATDLTGATTVRTETSPDASTFGVPFTDYFLLPDMWAFGVDDDGAVLFLGTIVTEVINLEIQEWHGLQARFALAGGAASTREWDLTEFRTTSGDTNPGSYEGGIFSVNLGGTLIAWGLDTGEGHSVLSQSDSATVPSDLWGATDLDSPATDVTSMSIGTGGSVVQMYGSDGSNYVIRRGSSGGTVIASTVDTYDGTNLPSVMYYFGV